MSSVLQSVAIGMACFAVGVVISYFFYKMTRRRGSDNWIDLVAQVQRVDFGKISLVARDYMNPQRGQISMEPGEMWELIGGYDGIRRMSENVDIMLALAAFAQRWNFDESVIVYHRIKSDATVIRR